MLDFLGKVKLVFVGDGINDVFVIVWVDVGIVMGGLGFDVVIEIVDVVLMIDVFLKVVEVIYVVCKIC